MVIKQTGFSRKKWAFGQSEPGDHILSYNVGWFSWSHSWHFFTVPPYSQYYSVKNSVRIPQNTADDEELGRESDEEESTSGGRVQTRKINN